MKKLTAIILILIGLNINAQEIMTDWKELDGEITLNDYFENQAYEYLNFKQTANYTLENSGVRISHRSANTKVIIRDQQIIPNIPLIVINQYPNDNWSIFKLIILNDVDKITLHKPSDKTFAIYGQRGKNGLIFVEMNKRKFRKLRRKYGR